MRHACRAPNAYSLHSALSAAFSTRTRLRSDAVAAQKQQQETAPTQHQPASDAPVGARAGSYASFESLSEQFRRGTTKSAAPVAPPRRAVPQRAPSSLAARQELVDGDHGAARVKQAKRPGPRPQPRPAAVKAAPRRPAKEQAAVPRPAVEQPVVERPAVEQAAAGQAAVGKATVGRAAVGRPAAHRATTHAPSDPSRLDRATHKPVTIKKYLIPQNTQSESAGQPVERPQSDWMVSMQRIGQAVNDTNLQLKEGTLHVDMEKLKLRLDYEGAHIPVAEPAASQRLPLPWALLHGEAEGVNATQRLDLEIARFAAYMEPTAAEKSARQDVAAKTRVLAWQTLARNKVKTKLFGSEKTGIALSTSDIDVRVYTNVNNQSISGPVLQRLYHAMFYSEDWVCAVFRDSNFPIISAQHRATGIDVQLVSAHSTAMQQSYTQKYLSELPHLRTLYILIHTMLSIRGLVPVFNGGIGSYGLFMMLVAALKRRSSDHPATASEQLLHFINFYTTFDTTKYGLSIDPTPKTFLKHDGDTTPLKDYITAARERGDNVRAGQWAMGQTRPLQPYLLCLQDPAKPTNDLGRKTNAIKHIQATLRHVGELLSSHMRELEECEASGTPWGRESLLELLVGRCNEVYFERRRKVEEYGQAILKANP
ncbi:hypothetical protein LTR08_000722 [Meristemomyces frigidus]|nr:hypothetical protein LTR08_000722 [Meristemomyces frigidus]